MSFIYIIQKELAKIYLADTGRRSLSRRTALIRSVKNQIRSSGLTKVQGTDFKDCRIHTHGSNKGPHDDVKIGDLLLDFSNKKLYRLFPNESPDESNIRLRNWKEILNLTNMISRIKVRSRIDWVFTAEDGRRSFSRLTALRRTARFRIVSSLENGFSDKSGLLGSKPNMYNDEVLSKYIGWLRNELRKKSQSTIKRLIFTR